MWSADRDGGAEGDDEMAHILNSPRKGRIGILEIISKLDHTAGRNSAHLEPG